MANMSHPAVIARVLRFIAEMIKIDLFLWIQKVFDGVAADVYNPGIIRFSQQIFEKHRHQEWTGYISGKGNFNTVRVLLVGSTVIEFE
jgi:hypothetical protein